MSDVVTPAITSVANDPMTALAMEVGALLEGGSLSGPWSVGDQGTSFGPFQIHLPAHPGVSAAQAQDARFAASYMEPAYESAAAQVPASLWQSNPEAAAERAAFLAERPAQDYYTARGASTVDAAYNNAVSALNGVPLNPSGGGHGVDFPSPGDIVSGAAGLVDQFNPFSIAGDFASSVGSDIIKGLVRLATFGTLLAAGGVLIALGAWRSVSPQTKSTAMTVGMAAAA